MSSSILDRLYAVTIPSQVQTPAKSPEILLLGLPHTGQDSLSGPLESLGYQDIYQNSTISAHRREDAVSWTRLLQKKCNRGSLSSTQRNFNDVLGGSEVVIADPASVLGQELIKCYPDAKIILNQPREWTVWHNEVLQRNSALFNRQKWLLSWFNSRLYWLYRMNYLVAHGYYGYDFEQNGIALAKAHYADLEDFLKDKNRQYLRWVEGDPLEPLCQFIQKPVPEQLVIKKKQPERSTTRDLEFMATRNLSIFMVFVGLLLCYFSAEFLMVLGKIFEIAGSSRVKKDVFPSDLGDTMFQNRRAAP